MPGSRGQGNSATAGAYAEQEQASWRARNIMDTATATPPASARARIMVVRGDAPRGFAFEAGTPAKLVVGSDPSASLCCRLPQVAPRHFDAVWDGANLWLEDALRLGRTQVNGVRLNEWLLVHGQVVVAFGPVRLLMSAEGPLPRGKGPDYAALDRARLTAAHQRAETRRCNTGRITLPPELAALRDTKLQRIR